MPVPNSVPAPGVVFDLVKLFENTFGTKPYVIPELSTQPANDGTPFKIDGFQNSPQLVTPKGSVIGEQYRGVDIWLPIRLSYMDQLICYIPYAVVNIYGKKIMVKTPMVERIGTVKEQYSIEDYVIGVKGFLISADRTFPEQEINNLKQVYEFGQAVQIENALTNIFLTNSSLQRYEQRRVVIEDLEIPEVQGGRKHVRPFSMKLESDTVFTLELDT